MDHGFPGLLVSKYPPVYTTNYDFHCKILVSMSIAHASLLNTLIQNYFDLYLGGVNTGGASWVVSDNLISEWITSCNCG